MSFITLNLRSLIKLTFHRLVQSDTAIGSAIFIGGIGSSALLIAACPSNILKEATESDKTRPYACCRP